MNWMYVVAATLWIVLIVAFAASVMSIAMSVVYFTKGEALHGVIFLCVGCYYCLEIGGEMLEMYRGDRP